jgi:hypothetical protein
MGGGQVTDISVHWEHFAPGMYTQVVDGDRVKGQVVLIDEYPDGRRFRVLVQIIHVEEIHD